MLEKIIKLKNDKEFIKTTCDIIKEHACKNIKEKDGLFLLDNHGFVSLFLVWSFLKNINLFTFGWSRTGT